MSPGGGWRIQEHKMRLSLLGLAAAAAVAVFSFGAAPAQAASLPKIDQVGTQNPGVEPVGYRRWGYRPYRNWGPHYPRTYRYTRPYNRYYGNYYYGPPYARYGRYGYWNRPYYGRRYY